MPFSHANPFTLGVTTPQPTVVATGYDRNTSSQTAITQNIPSGTSLGHTMLAIVCSNTNNGGGGSATPTESSGTWTLLSGGTDNGTCGLFFFTKKASSSESTYSWTLPKSKNTNTSLIITIIFRDATIGAVQAIPTFGTASPEVISWSRSGMNSLIIPVLFSTATSTNNFTAVTDPTGFTRLVDAIDSVNSYADAVAWTSGPGKTTSSGSASITLSGSNSNSNMCMGYVEVLPSTYITPTSPTFIDYSQAAQSVTGTTNNTYDWTTSWPSKQVGDIVVVFSTVNNSIAGWYADSGVGWTIAYSRITSPAIMIAYKTVTGSESAVGIGITFNNNSTKAGWTQMFTIRGGVYDTIGTADTNSSGGGVGPTVTVANSYSLALAFLESSASGNWSAPSGSGFVQPFSGALEQQSQTPAMDIFYVTDLSAQTLSPGNFTSGTGGVGSTFGILMSISHD
jgi:hypothetical protein